MVVESATASLPVEQEPLVLRSTVASPARVFQNIRFRPILPKDRDRVQELHEQWFPVTYKDEFYDELVFHRMVNSGEELFTCVATYQQQQQQDNNNNNNNDEMDDDDDDDDDDDQDNHCGGGGRSICEKLTRLNLGEHQNNLVVCVPAAVEEETIVACVVGTFIPVDRLPKGTTELLVGDPTVHTRLFYIMTLGTVLSFRHLRLATMLVERVSAMVERDAACGALYLHVITFNVPAIRFYEKLGFYRVTEIKDYYHIDGKNHNCYLYAKYFNGNHGHKDWGYLTSRFFATTWERLTSVVSIVGDHQHEQ